MQNWLYLLGAVVLLGAAVSRTTVAVLARVRHRESAGPAELYSPSGPSSLPSTHGATRELAAAIGVSASCIRVTDTGGNEIICSIEVEPAEIVQVQAAAELAVDGDFRERHGWSSHDVVLQIATATD